MICDSILPSVNSENLPTFSLPLCTNMWWVVAHKLPLPLKVLDRKHSNQPIRHQAQTRVMNECTDKKGTSIYQVNKDFSKTMIDRQQGAPRSQDTIGHGQGVRS